MNGFIPGRIVESSKMLTDLLEEDYPKVFSACNSLQLMVMEHNNDPQAPIISIKKSLEIIFLELSDMYRKEKMILLPYLKNHDSSANSLQKNALELVKKPLRSIQLQVAILEENAPLLGNKEFAAQLDYFCVVVENLCLKKMQLKF